ncbi:MAG: hypothetical protein WC322_02875, partial [Candidatus Paceibacterota bacterium]
MTESPWEQPDFAGKTIQDLEIEVTKLQESINSRIDELDGSRWTAISGWFDNEEDGPTLDRLRNLSPKLREMAASNPWHVRGAQLRHGFVFGRGLKVINMPPRIKKVVEDPHNAAVMFSIEAYEAANLALFTDGNYFVARDTTTNLFTQIPLRQITAVSTDPDDSSTLWYVQRTWVSNGREQKSWYPVARYKKRVGKVRAEIQGTPVSKTAVIYHQASHRQTGWTWGVPDSLAAMTWTEAYSAYLRDNAKLVKALSMIAWKITQATTSGASAASATVRDSGAGIGGTAAMAAGSQLQGVGVPSAQVNMGNGQPLIAAVATSFGVPVIALLSSPGATGGSYGAAATLDEPTFKTMSSLQDMWANFYNEVLADIGGANSKVEFPSLQTDPAYRQ